MPYLRPANPLPIHGTALAFVCAALLAAGGSLATDTAVAKGRPSPKPTPTPTATPAPSPSPSPSPTPGCTVTGSVIPGSGESTHPFNDVEAVAANDIWAVGSFSSALAHSNGRSWSLVDDPNAGNGTELLGVAAASTDDIWAVGSTLGGQFGLNQALAERWDGQRWSVVGGTPFGTTSRLFDVAVLSPNDVWAVGYYASQATNNWQQPLVEHWDGTAWHVVESPSLGTSSELHGVAALAPNNIWAVGNTYATRYETLVLHWDGTSWTRVQSPNVGPYGNGLTSVSAVSATDIWAVGVGNNSGVSLTIHWDGTAWSVVPSPNSTNLFNLLQAVAARATDDVWAVGFSEFVVQQGEDEEYHDRALLMHWDGAVWSLFDSAASNTDDNRRNGVDTLSDGEAWVVGSHVAFGGPLIERYRCQ